jgi:predicted lipid carrier protein YhbT
MSVAKWALKLGQPLLPYSRHVPFAIQRRVIELAAARLFATPLSEGAFHLLENRWLRLEVSDLDLVGDGGHPKRHPNHHRTANPAD